GPRPRARLAPAGLAAPGDVRATRRVRAGTATWCGHESSLRSAAGDAGGGGEVVHLPLVTDQPKLGDQSKRDRPQRLAVLDLAGVHGGDDLGRGRLEPGDADVENPDAGVELLLDDQFARVRPPRLGRRVELV